jgi:hypothetical protein
MRLPLLTVVLALLALIPLPLAADKIHLKDGRIIEGTIVSESDTEVKIDIGKKGAKITFKKSEVERIDRTAASPEELYKSRLLVTDRANVDSLVHLADWCAMNTLAARAAEHYLEALAIQPDHARARGRMSDLGWKEVEGKWLSPEEQKRLAEPPPPPVKPDVPKGPTSEDVARERGAWVLPVSAEGRAGIGVWAAVDGTLWVTGPAASAAGEAMVDLGDGKRAPAKVMVRDRLRGIALWQAEAEGKAAPHLEYGPLAEPDPLVAVGPGGLVENVFPRGWELASPEFWLIRLEGSAAAAAIFNLDGRLVGITGDGRGAISAFDLTRLRKTRAPAPEGNHNAAGSWWRALDVPEKQKAALLKEGAMMDMFEPGLGVDEMNRASALSSDLSKAGVKILGDFDDRIAALRLARHCARAGRVSFGIAAADVEVRQAQLVLDLVPRLKPIELARMRAVLDGLGPDPAGVEASVNGEVARAEAVMFGTRDLESEIDLQIGAFPFLGPARMKSLDDGKKRVSDAVQEQRAFAARVRAACTRPDPARAEELRAIEAGPGLLADFPSLRDRALKAMTAIAAARLAVRLGEYRADLGDFPAQAPSGADDPVSGKPFDYKPDADGVTLTAPSGEVFRVRK